MPSMIGKAKTQQRLIDKLQDEFAKVYFPLSFFMDTEKNVFHTINNSVLMTPILTPTAKVVTGEEENKEAREYKRLVDVRRKPGNCKHFIMFSFADLFFFYFIFLRFIGFPTLRNYITFHLGNQVLLVNAITREEKTIDDKTKACRFRDDKLAS